MKSHGSGYARVLIGDNRDIERRVRFGCGGGG